MEEKYKDDIKIRDAELMDDAITQNVIEKIGIFFKEADEIDQDKDYTNDFLSIMGDECVVAGGFILSTIHAYPAMHISERRLSPARIREYISDVTNVDMDIYISLRKLKELLSIIPKKYKIKERMNLHISVYDNSFFVRNGILMRIPLVYEQLEIDIIVVEPDREILHVISNFDLSFCKIWFDGQYTLSFHKQDVLTKHGYLDQEYSKYYMKGNRYIKRRVCKYLSRGFTIKSESIIVSENLIPSDVSLSDKYRCIIKNNEKTSMCNKINNMNDALKYIFRKLLSKFAGTLRWGSRDSQNIVFKELGRLSSRVNIIDKINIEKSNEYLYDKLNAALIVTIIKRVIDEDGEDEENEEIFWIKICNNPYVVSVANIYKTNYKNFGISISSDKYIDKVNLYKGNRWRNEKINPFVRYEEPKDCNFEEISFSELKNDIDLYSILQSVQYDIITLNEYIVKQYLMMDVNNFIIINADNVNHVLLCNRKQIFDSLYDMSGTFVECKQSIQGAPYTNDVIFDKWYIRLNSDAVNSAIPVKCVHLILRHPYGKIYFMDDYRLIENASSIDNVRFNNASNIFGDNINIMSGYHCTGHQQLNVYDKIIEITNLDANLNEKYNKCIIS